MDVFKNGVLYLAKDRFELNFCDEVPHLKNLKTMQKTPMEVVEMPSKFRWIDKGVKYFLLIERDTTEKLYDEKTKKIDYVSKIKLSTSKK